MFIIRGAAKKFEVHTIELNMTSRGHSLHSYWILNSYRFNMNFLVNPEKSATDIDMFLTRLPCKTVLEYIEEYTYLGCVVIKYLYRMLYPVHRTLHLVTFSYFSR